MICARYGLVCAALAVASGCAQDNLSLQIVHNQFTDPSTCMRSASDTSNFLSHGTAELSGGGYIFTPLLRSNLRANATGANTIQLSSVTIEIEPVNRADSRATVEALQELKGLSHRISGSIEPGGFAALSFPGIDSAQAAVLATVVEPGQGVEVLLKVIVYGDATGTGIESQPFYYPVTLLNTGSALRNKGPCSSIPLGTVGNDKDCFDNGQDGGFIECCTDPGGLLVCPAEGTAPP